MKQLLNAVIGAVLGLNMVPAMAQDWSGLYAGVQIGYGFGDAGGRIAVGPLPRFDSSPEGPLTGAFMGYNWMMSPNWVAGVEGDISVSDISDRGTSTAPPAAFNQRLKNAAALRVRAGYSMGRYMPYAALGVAAGQVKTQALNVVATNPSGKKVHKGFTAALGMDMFVSDNAWMRVEFRHTNYGGASYAFNELPGIVALRMDDYVSNEIRIGYALKF